MNRITELVNGLATLKARADEARNNKMQMKLQKFSDDLHIIYNKLEDLRTIRPIVDQLIALGYDTNTKIFIFADVWHHYTGFLKDNTTRFGRTGGGAAGKSFYIDLETGKFIIKCENSCTYVYKSIDELLDDQYFTTEISGHAARIAYDIQYVINRAVAFAEELVSKK